MRVPVRVAAELSTGGQVFEAITRSLSTEGAQIFLYGAAASVVPGASALLRFTLPVAAEPLYIETDVRWVRGDITDQWGRRCLALGLLFRRIAPEARQALESFTALTRPIVLAVGGLGPASVEALIPEFAVETSDSASSARDLLTREEIAVAVLGPGLPGEAASSFLAATRQQFPGLTTRFIVLAAGGDLSLFQDVVDDDTVFFLTESPVAPEELRAIVRSAAASWARAPHGVHDTGLDSAEQISRLRTILDLAQRFAVQNDAFAIADLAGEAVRDLVAADRGSCLIYDVRDQVLRSRGADGEVRSESAAAGLVSFAARTGLVLRVPHAAEDGRYDRDADDPQGTGDERLLAIPVSDGGESRVLAVLVAVRAASRAEFAPEDAQTLGLLARHVGAVLGRLALHADLERAAADAGTFAGRAATDVYREEALRHYVSAGERGDVLRVSERWMTWTFRLIAISLLGGLLFTSLASVHQYATGLAVVRLDGGGQVVGLLPGHYLPTLRPGLPLWIDLNGFQNEPQRFDIESVGDEVMGREEALRYLGSRVSAEMLPPGPLVLVRARLSSSSFMAQGHSYRYYDGMIGTAQVQIESERLLTALVPSLKARWHD
jgi:hypothetical protein